MKSRFDLQQNGYIKVKNQNTKTVVRFHIKTEKGERTKSRKREKRWIRLGKVIEGRVELTEYKAKEKVNRLYREILNNPADSRFAAFAYQQEARCNLCNRPLKNTMSIWRGYGPECAKYVKG